MQVREALWYLGQDFAESNDEPSVGDDEASPGWRRVAFQPREVEGGPSPRGDPVAGGRGDPRLGPGARPEPAAPAARGEPGTRSP